MAVEVIFFKCKSDPTSSLVSDAFAIKSKALPRSHGPARSDFGHNLTNTIRDRLAAYRLALSGQDSSD